MKVGLLSSDEVVFAGGKYGTDNTSYYLKIDIPPRLGSPFSFIGNNAKGFIVAPNGDLDNDYISYNVYATAPVIKIRSDIIYISGNGEKNTPYVVSIG